MPAEFETRTPLTVHCCTPAGLIFWTKSWRFDCPARASRQKTKAFPATSVATEAMLVPPDPDGEKTTFQSCVPVAFARTMVLTTAATTPPVRSGAAEFTGEYPLFQRIVP